jgi:hypothetical protein
VRIYLPAVAAQTLHIRLFNALGQEVYSKTVLSAGNEEIQIPLYQAAPGMYWIQLTGSAGFRITKQLLVLK